MQHLENSSTERYRQSGLEEEATPFHINIQTPQKNIQSFTGEGRAEPIPLALILCTQLAEKASLLDWK